MYQEKLLPHDVEAEEAVLGSLLIDGESITKVAHFLKADDFYRERNRICYEACHSLFRRGDAINQVTLAHQLSIDERTEQVGGMAYLSHLVANVPTPVHIDHYARIVTKTSVMRRIIDSAARISDIGYEGTDDVEGALSRAEDILYQVRTGQVRRDFVPIREVLDQYLQEQAAAIDEPLGGIGAPIMTGFDRLDELLGGLHPSDMVVLAARPSLGKSTLAMNMALNAARNGASVGVFSLEMSREQLALRLLAGEAAVDSQRLRLGLYTEAEERRIIGAIGGLSELPIYIDDTPLQWIVEMRSKAHHLHAERGVDFLVVDYIQIIQKPNSRGDNRVQEMSEITRSIKGLARDLNVPVLAVSQMNRAVEGRTSHRPQLSDLRESGSIEQDADVVMFINRDEINYTEEEWFARYGDERPYPRHVAEIVVSKHRHGPVGSVKLLFRENLVKFESAALELEGF
ncbi:MAG: replicative DNA helicase [Dehalococcoidia bacterium]|nr:replicative DNA helicase [Dehalococcoidia bacterium]